MRGSRLHSRFRPPTFLLSFAVQLIMICAAASLLTGCALPNPDTLACPTPIHSNAGKYLNPYLADGTLAPWADKGVHANRIAAGVGGFAASMAIGIVDPTGLGGTTADVVIKQQGAILFCGGADFMKSTSDTSFDRREDFIVFIYVNYSTNELYRQMLDMMVEIYPDVGWCYDSDIRNAPKKSATPVKGAG